MHNEKEKIWIETLQERVKSVQENKELWCPHCAKFTPFQDLKFHGKNENGEEIESERIEDIFEFEGYIYTCGKCGYLNEGMGIGRIDI